MKHCPEPHNLIDAAYGESTEWDAHIASCSDCQAEVRAIRSMSASLAAMPMHSADHIPVRIPAKRHIPYGAIAACVIFIITFSFGIQIQYSPDGGWSISFGLVQSQEVAAAVVEPQPEPEPAVTVEMIEKMQQDQLTAINTIIQDYVTLTETRRGLDYQLIQFEIEDLKARTDEHLYRSNLAMLDLLSQLSYATQN
jgi:hypothetical protein